jgi:hypothetical protein
MQTFNNMYNYDRVFNDVCVPADALATLQEDPASRSCSLYFVVRPNQAPVTCDKVLQTFSLTPKELETFNPGMKCMPGQPVPRGTLMCVKGGCAHVLESRD